MAVHLLVKCLLFCFVILTMLKIATLNVQGLRNQEKQQFLFSFIHEQKFDIIALQEVHFSSADVKRWQKNWEGLSFWRPGGTNRAGVAFLFKKNLDCKAEIIDQDFNGSILCAQVTYENFTFQLLNLYGPGQETRQSCNSFFDEVHHTLKSYHW